MIKPTKKQLIFGAAGLVVLLGQVFLARFLIARFQPAAPGDVVAAEAGAEAAPEAKSAAQEEKTAEGEETKEEVGEIYLIKDIVVNPAETEGRRYVSLNIALEMGADASLADIERNEPIIRDIVIRIIVQKTIDQLDGRQDIDILKYQILRALSKRLGDGVIRHIYLDNYVLQ